MWGRVRRWILWRLPPEQSAQSVEGVIRLRHSELWGAGRTGIVYPDLLRVVAQRQQLWSVGMRIGALAFLDARALRLLSSDLLHEVPQGRIALGIDRRKVVRRRMVRR